MSIFFGDKMEFPLVKVTKNCEELEYVSDNRELIQLSHGVLLEGDQLIDSQGKRFSWQFDKWQIEHKAISLAQFEQLIQCHADALSHCCVAKLRLTSYKDGIEFVGNS